jgi:type I restriction enzyme, S subunit
MRLNYKKIGDYIKEVDERNKGLKVKKLLGLSISKQFIPSVANIIGTDMENYKIICKNQFACSTMQVRRDKKMPVALLQNFDEAIISQAYPIFEVKDDKELLPEYLMMWFTRTEFDREACFNAVGGVRGSLEWEDFCDMQLPIPTIAKQKEIVKEYNVIQNRIALNKQLIQKLEDTAQAIYKQWFVDFEFPDENGKGYKSGGGEMVFNEELGKEIPKGWEVEALGNLVNYKKGFAFKSENYVESGVPVYRVSDFTDKSIDVTNCHYLDESLAKELIEYELRTNDIIITTVGSWPDNPASIVGKVIIVPELANNGLLNQNAVRLRTNDIAKQLFIYYRLNRKDYSEFVISGAQGSANQASVTLEHIFSFKIIIPQKNENLFLAFNKINDNILKINTENNYLYKFKNLLLSKIATIEN